MKKWLEPEEEATQVTPAYLVTPSQPLEIEFTPMAQCKEVGQVRLEKEITVSQEKQVREVL